jgi:BirA family transcriptional regulator, biotin operon repressor / biotin---[acetyl-CoA-carboxylase] ligase
VVLRPAGGWSPRWAALGLAVGLGLREGLARWVDARLKWPNDLLCGGRKLAGVLCETRWLGAAPDVVAGFGVNVGQRAFPEGLTATSLALELSEGTCPSRQEVLDAALAGLAGVLAEFFAGGFPAIQGRYAACSAVLGQTVRVGGEACEARGFADDGALLVARGGELRRVESEDVWICER